MNSILTVNRVVVQDANECCEAYINTYDQPAAMVILNFPTATSYTEYLGQEEKLQELLVNTKACEHIRDIAIRTHKTLCGNDTHVATARRAYMFPGIDPDLVETLLGDV